jgi:hypothetical protein
LTAEEAVQLLNQMYMGFNESNDTSPLGVTISFAGDSTSFHGNIFCEGYAPDNTSCYKGGSDCGMSSACINHKVMIEQQNSGSKVAPLMNRAVGYVFNQTMVETYLGKCTYLYDGANSLNVNSRCGASAHGEADCDDPHAAFYNMCTDDDPTDPHASYHTCTKEDPEITGMMCKCESCHPQYGTKDPPRQKADQTCFYEMPALIVPADGPNSFIPSTTNHLRDAMKQRVEGDKQTNQQREWNEVVLDEKLLIPQFHYDPTHTILAFVYVAGSSVPAEQAQSFANAMRDDFQSIYQVSGVSDIPVIELNAMDDFTQTGGPFKLAASQHRVVV